MKFYINHDFEDISPSFDIRNPDWIFKKLPCLTNCPHGVENVLEFPFVNMRPYIEIDDIEQLSKLADDINNISWQYRLVVEPREQIRFYEEEITYE